MVVVGGGSGSGGGVEVRERCKRSCTQCGGVLGWHHRCEAHLFAHVKPCFKSTVRHHFRVDQLAISAVETSAQDRLQSGHCCRKRVRANRSMSQSLADLATRCRPHFEVRQKPQEGPRLSRVPIAFGYVTQYRYGYVLKSGRGACILASRGAHDHTLRNAG